MHNSPHRSLDFATYYNGGAFLTNAYAIFLPPAQQGQSHKRECILIDAPEGTREWLDANGLHVRTLLLTHGHIDHIFDAAAIQKEHGCKIYHHADTVPFLSDRDVYRRYGIPMDIEPVVGGKLLDETAAVDFDGVRFQVLLVPGHCPGSLCFYHEPSKSLFSGDTLFAGAVGRWDLPGGDQQTLLTMIRQKLLNLPKDVQVYPGHGPPTTIGNEKSSNPFLI